MKNPLASYYHGGKLQADCPLPTKKMLSAATPQQVRKFAHELAQRQAEIIWGLKRRVEGLHHELDQTIDAKLRDLLGAPCCVCGDHGAQWLKKGNAGMEYRLCDHCDMLWVMGRIDPAKDASPGRRPR